MSAIPAIIEILRAVVAGEDAGVVAEKLGEVRLVLDATLPTAGRIHLTPHDPGLSSAVVHFAQQDRRVKSVTIMAQTGKVLTSIAELKERFGNYRLGSRTGAMGPREATFLVEVDVRSDRIGILSALVFNDREPIEKWRVAGLTIANGPRV